MIILIALLVSVIAFSVSPLLTVAALVVAGVAHAPDWSTQSLVVLFGLVSWVLIGEGIVQL